MNNIYERLIARASTIDELLSDDFETLPGQKSDVDLAAHRLAIWCRSCASGDWLLFNRWLEQDGLSLAEVLSRFSTVRRSPSASIPVWIHDSMWILLALRGRNEKDAISTTRSQPLVLAPEPVAFQDLFVEVVDQAEVKLWAEIGPKQFGNLTEQARADLCHSLLKKVSGLCAPALYERFNKMRKSCALSTESSGQQGDSATSQYRRFVAEMKDHGWDHLFEDKPVMLRLIAVIIRQWLNTSREFVTRLDADLVDVRRNLLQREGGNRVAMIEDDLSDPHNGGRTVLIVSLDDGSRFVYKPKNLHLDKAWHALILTLNNSGAPVKLKAVRSIVRDGYGWTEFIDHTGCVDTGGCKLFFRRAGAWLALFHCFASTDMHQENVIANGEHPVPIDLEMILQGGAEENKTDNVEAQAFEAAVDVVENSVIAVGLLPSYGRTPDNKVFTVGGMVSDWSSGTKLVWSRTNSNVMRPAKAEEPSRANPNLPHVDGHYAKFGDHIDDFISGFEEYARFLQSRSRDTRQKELFDDFAGLEVRRIVRPTRFYSMLLQRLKDHRTMNDGVSWSAQADFLARLIDWTKEPNPIRSLQRAERSALLALNVPHFVSSSDGNGLSDATGISVRTDTVSGLDRARKRIENLDAQDIAWQTEVIRLTTSAVPRSSFSLPDAMATKRSLRSGVALSPTKETFLAEAGKLAEQLSHCAIRKGPAAAWIGLDWIGDSEVSQFVPLGTDLYNGVCGIAVFLAAHASVTGHKSSADLALSAVLHLRTLLRGKNATRTARLLGTGGATGLGSIVYALTIMSKCLQDDDLLADAHVAATLFSDDLIAADKQLGVIGGSAGGILGLLRLYRDTQSSDVLSRAVKCGEHLLAQKRFGSEGSRSWGGQGLQQALNGMSHGAAGFAYALSSLSMATGRKEFANSAVECISFENSSYNAERSNWPDFRGSPEPLWPSQWCHGACGIGLARVGMLKQGGPLAEQLVSDIHNALVAATQAWPNPTDALCCGTFGSIEFLGEAGRLLKRSDLSDLATRNLAAVMETSAAAGGYRWNTGSSRSNLGLFRGLAGAGYTILRKVDSSLPNILIWE